ncbi:MULTISPECIES: hypothetical protein [Vibrio]|uniref:Uncharacterized protein n=1 Tax=Vibrio atlanticus TaxID=693153 RepID=A0ABV4KS43_9VIBR|nr:hypothetical protein [Vibrio crassostreae]TCT59008.1 hypothetical protein EDB31_1702 [Vibrio crassostreae]
MSEFNNRISAQRDALKIVNGSGLFVEALLSLTEKAIDRWSRNNKVGEHDAIATLLKSMSGTLFFLANKSQEQVTEDYKDLSDKVRQQLFELGLEVANMELKRKKR